MKFTTFLVFSVFFLGCDLFAKMTGKEVKVETDKQKISYAIGQQIGGSFKQQSIDVDLDVFSAAISDAIEGKSKLTKEEMAAALDKMRTAMAAEQEKAATANLTAGQKFLEENKKKEGVKTTESGLQYTVITEGKGKSPKATDKVRVHYVGTLLDGTQFDSSVERKEPAEFPLNGVIKGWTEGVQLMKTGSKYKFFVPAELAYGPQGRPSIPGNSVLTFEIELLDVL